MRWVGHAVAAEGLTDVQVTRRGEEPYEGGRAVSADFEGTQGTTRLGGVLLVRVDASAVVSFISIAEVERRDDMLAVQQRMISSFRMPA